MKRRTVLWFIGAGGSSVSGCLSSIRDLTENERSTGTPPATPDSTPPVDSGGTKEFDPVSIYKQVGVGTRNGVKDDFQPHALLIWNSLENDIQISVRILDRIAETTAHRAEYAIPAEQALKVKLLAPSRYYVQLWGPAIDATETLLAPCGLFDCNDSQTGIGIYDSGEVHSSVTSTLAGCPSPDC